MEGMELSAHPRRATDEPIETAVGANVPIRTEIGQKSGDGAKDDSTVHGAK